MGLIAFNGNELSVLMLEGGVLTYLPVVTVLRVQALHRTTLR